MAIREFNLENLHTVDAGRVDAIFKRHLTRAIQDCEDRPADKTARKVLLQVEIKPDMPMEGVVDVNVECVVTSKIPSHISRPINCQVRKRPGGGTLAAFNDMSEGDVDQRTLDELGD